MRSDQILARTMRYGDELTLLEQGKKVEREQFIENSYNPLSTMPQMLKQRVFSKTEAVRLWEKRQRVLGGGGPLHSGGTRSRLPEHDPVLAADAAVILGRSPTDYAQHGIECPCDACLAAVKRLLIACGVLPRGKRLMGRGKP